MVSNGSHYVVVASKGNDKDQSRTWYGTIMTNFFFILSSPKHHAISKIEENQFVFYGASYKPYFYIANELNQQIRKTKGGYVFGTYK